MADATQPTRVAEDDHSSSLVPVDVWRIDSTSQHVAMRLFAVGSSGIAIEAGEYAFRLAPEQARQIIRDLSSAVLASDVKRKTEAGDAG